MLCHSVCSIALPVPSTGVRCGDLVIPLTKEDVEELASMRYEPPDGETGIAVLKILALTNGNACRAQILWSG